MKPEIKTNWLTALRSGKYTQAMQTLRENDEGNVAHCCLGVLCDIIDSKRWDGEDYLGTAEDELDEYDDMPPPSILGAAELSATDAEKLATMNDNGRTFEEIADMIEVEL